MLFRSVKSIDGGTTFSTEVLLAGYNEQCYFHNIVTNSTGKLYATICAHSAPNFAVWLYESTDGGTSFSPPIALSDASKNYQFREVHITIGADDDVYALWADNRAGFYNVYFVKADMSLSVDILESNFNNEFVLYPNPTSGSFNVKTSQKEIPLEITVFDLQGHILYKRSYNNTSNVNIDINMSQGIYLVTVKSNNEIRTLKLIKD